MFTKSNIYIYRKKLIKPLFSLFYFSKLKAGPYVKLPGVLLSVGNEEYFSLYTDPFVGKKGSAQKAPWSCIMYTARLKGNKKKTIQILWIDRGVEYQPQVPHSMQTFPLIEI